MVLAAVLERLALNVKIQVSEMIRVDHRLILALQAAQRVTGAGQFSARGAAKGHADIAARRLQPADTVPHPVANRLLAIPCRPARAILARHHKGQREKSRSGRLSQRGQIKLPRAIQAIRSEITIWPGNLPAKRNPPGPYLPCGWNSGPRARRGRDT